MAMSDRIEELKEKLGQETNNVIDVMPNKKIWQQCLLISEKLGFEGEKRIEIAVNLYGSRNQKNIYDTLKSIDDTLKSIKVYAAITFYFFAFCIVLYLFSELFSF